MSGRQAPRIAVLLDENTSGGATRYEASKGYFQAVFDVGGIAFGIPYNDAVADNVICEFDGLLTAGGRFAYPDDWYVEGETSNAPSSDRFAIEQRLVKGFLERRKPVLGLCAGMQMIACLHGCRLVSDLRSIVDGSIDHDGSRAFHPVTIEPGTQLATAIQAEEIVVNSLHREAVSEVNGPIKVCATAPDGVIEAIEVEGANFAIGLQWHQERFAGSRHPGNEVFRALVAACRADDQSA